MIKIIRINGVKEHIDEIVIHLGIKPVNGGIPLRERRSRGIINCIRGDIEFSLLNWLLLINLKVLIIRNRGVITRQYIMKYVSVSMGFIIYNMLDIHPMCVMEEYAMIVRKCDWFIPNIPPKIALIIEMVIIIDEYRLFSRNERITRGASFCHVARIIHEIQDRDVITEGNQK